MERKKTEWKKPRAFSLSNNLYAELMVMAEEDGISLSLEVSNLIAVEWEKRFYNAGDRTKRLEKLGEMKEKIQ